MSFFVQQDKARKQTRFLVLLFVVAVLAIIATINLIFYLAINWQTTTGYSLQSWFSQPYWIMISGGALALIVLVSLWRSWQLNASPDAIAKMVKATAVDLNSREPQEVRLVNVVEEMAIASGMPIPKIYVMKSEPGINAFVAGLNPSSTTLVVTQGLLDSLNRQELQGVIAHEYSHVFHGDMRINVRLIGVLAGLLVIGQLGHILLRSGSHGRYSRRYSSSGKSSGNAGAVMLVGVGLFVVGYIGLFFGRLIKAAISRQREFLADASAVQYTRDKEGISRALGKIAQHSGQSLLNSDKAEEMSHLCFGASVNNHLGRLFATHPPIDERIRAINPQLARELADSGSTGRSPSSTGPSSTSQAAQNDRDTTSAFDQPQTATLDSSAPLGVAAFSAGSDTAKRPQPKINTNKIIQNIGNLSPRQLKKVEDLMTKLPPLSLSLIKSLEYRQASYAVITALLLVNANGSDDRSADSVRQWIPPAHFESLVAELAQIDFSAQHALLDLALARIEQMPSASNRQFVTSLASLVSNDESISQTEFMIYASAVKRALPTKQKNATINRFKQLQTEINYLFNLFYQQSQLSHQQKQKLFERRLKSLGIQPQPLSSSVAARVKILGRALDRVARLNPLLKGEFIQNCIEIASNDGQINQTEYELLRLLGEYLDSPLSFFPE